MSARSTSVRSSAARWGGSQQPDMDGKNYGLSSRCSSETANRILSLQIQLEMERQRRLEVERMLQGASEMGSSRSGRSGRSNLPPVPLTASNLEQATANKPASTRSASHHRQEHRNIPAPPALKKPSCDNYMSTLPPAGHRVSPVPSDGHDIVPSKPSRTKERRRPPLPKAAKPAAGVRKCVQFSKHRVSDIDMYLANQRHASRMAALAAFELPDTKM